MVKANSSCNYFKHHHFDLQENKQNIKQTTSNAHNFQQLNNVTGTCTPTSNLSLLDCRRENSFSAKPCIKNLIRVPQGLYREETKLTNKPVHLSNGLMVSSSLNCFAQMIYAAASSYFGQYAAVLPFSFFLA